MEKDFSFYNTLKFNINVLSKAKIFIPLGLNSTVLIEKSLIAEMLPSESWALIVTAVHHIKHTENAIFFIADAEFIEGYLELTQTVDY